MLISSVQFSPCVWLFVTPRTVARQASLSITNSRAYSNLCPLSRWCHPTISSSVVPFLLPSSIFPSIGVFSNEWVLRIRWPQYWSFSFSINEYSRLICFMMDWLDLLAVQGTRKSLLQYHSSKALVPQHSAYFIVQLSHPYMTNGKTIALTRRAFVGKVMSLLFFFCLCFLICSLVLSLVMDREAHAAIHGISKSRTRLRDWSDLRFVIAFLLRSKCLLISWLQSPSAVVLEPKKAKSITISIVFP